MERYVPSRTEVDLFTRTWLPAALPASEYGRVRLLHAGLLQDMYPDIWYYGEQATLLTDWEHRMLKLLQAGQPGRLLLDDIAHTFEPHMDVQWTHRMGEKTHFTLNEALAEKHITEYYHEPMRVAAPRRTWLKRSVEQRLLPLVQQFTPDAFAMYPKVFGAFPAMCFTLMVQPCITPDMAELTAAKSSLAALLDRWNVGKHPKGSVDHYLPR